MAAENDELIQFAEEGEAGERGEPQALPWRVLVVDDDAEVHRATAFAL